MILCPTGWPVSHRASKRLSNAARSCARHDRERNALSCWQTWKTGTFMHPSLWAGHSKEIGCGAEPGVNHPAEGRTNDAGDIARDRVQGDGIPEIVARDRVGDHRLAHRLAQGMQGPSEEGERGRVQDS